MGYKTLLRILQQIQRRRICSRSRKTLRKIKEIILHCSDSDVRSHDKIEVIREWHLLRGFYDVGYHYFINKKGRVFEGRPIEKIGAHCKGHNKNSIGICVSGRFDFKTPQSKSLKSLLFDLCLEYGLSFEDIKHHGEYNKNKTCPNFNFKDFH